MYDELRSLDPRQRRRAEQRLAREGAALGLLHNRDVSTSISLRVPRRRLIDDTRRQLLARHHPHLLALGPMIEKWRVP